MGACREATVQTAEMWQLVPTETLPAHFGAAKQAGRPQKTGGAGSGLIPSLHESLKKQKQQVHWFFKVTF